MMVTIFRQPGKTGIGVKAEDSAGLENGKNCHVSSSKRKRKMKLNSVIFCLCAGLCSSTLIENAFSMNENRNLANKLCKIDKYSMMVASKYFENLDDFMNLEMINKKFRGIANERFHYNPISITPDQLHLWPNLETLHLYTYADINAWRNAPIDNLYKIEVWNQLHDTLAAKHMIELEHLVAKSANPNAKITFRNVILTDHKNLGKLKDGHYIFDENVYTNSKRKNANFVITSMSEDAFYVCKELKSITIPDSVTYIGAYAFRWCDELTYITIPNRMQSIDECAFFGCDRLASITIPNSVKSIGVSAFHGCEGLTSVTIPNSVTSIGKSAFHGCTGLTSVTIPNGVQSIGALAFCGCYRLTSITIPDRVTSIGERAFLGCEGLTSIEIPKSVEFIYRGTFSGCIGLTSITIPNSIESIERRAFWNCNNAEFTVPYNAMKEHLFETSGIDRYRITVTGSTNETTAWVWRDGGRITIPDGIDSINDAMFTNRVDIKSITIPNSVTSIGVSAFHKCTGLTSITIPNSVQLIGECAFWECEGLTSITIPDSVTWIDDDAFSDCIGLTSIKIPDSVKLIGDYTFSVCKSLTSITIPDSVELIGNSAFEDCINLKKVFVYSDRVKRLVNDVLRDDEYYNFNDENEQELDYDNIIEIIEKSENEPK